MSRTRLNGVGLLLLGFAVLLELVGCGGRTMGAGQTDSSVQTGTDTGTGTITSVQTVTGLGTLTDITTGTYTHTVPLTATYSYSYSYAGSGSGVFTITNSGVITSPGTGTGVLTRTRTGTGVITRTRTGVSTSTGVNTFSSTGVITGTIISTGVYTISSSGVRTISSTGSGTSVGCAYAVPPTASGTLAVTGGYVTSGTLRGYGFTWKSDQSNATTCIVPTCNTTGCSPAFGSSALCASGYVTADTTYNSAVGVGFNLNQDSSGTTNLTVPAPASVTVTTSLFGGAMGNPAMRVQITDAAGTSWCVEAGQWASGTPIPISSFNTAWWDSMTGKTLTAGQPIQSINLVIPADAVMDRPFAFCLTGVFL